MADAKWYVVHTQTGVESRVKLNLESRAELAGMRHLIHQVLVPTEKVSEVRSGKKKRKRRKLSGRWSFPWVRIFALKKAHSQILTERLKKLIPIAASSR